MGRMQGPSGDRMAAGWLRWIEPVGEREMVRGMRMVSVGLVAGCVTVLGCVFARGQVGSHKESERKVIEAEVPKKALEALQKLADKAVITEFAEEFEHGHRFYEGSWKGPHGNIDALVTESGDVVEIEEVIPSDKVPAKARAEVEKEAGKKAKMTWEKKTFVLYEVHYKKDGKGHEIILTPDGRRYHEEGGGQDEKDNDNDE
jgi:hypothetical protein